MINEHMTEWLGLPVTLFDPEDPQGPSTPEEAEKTVFHLMVDYGEEMKFDELFARFLASPWVSGVKSLIIGNWGQADMKSATVVKLLAEARDTLTNLKAIFLGDIIQEQWEISWISQCDMTPLFTAYPGLEHFAVRGITGMGQEDSALSLGEGVHLPRLKSLTIQCGGMPLKIYQQATQGNFPALERLELWLGTETYGGEVEAAHLTELLSGQVFPELQHLALCNSDRQDDVAAAVAGSALVKRLKSLDLSMGTISDRGGEALLTSAAVCGLDFVDLHHHYFSEDMMKLLRANLRQVNLDEAEGADTDEEDRYVAVGE